ncbi:MAG: 1-deoxy-D-xylulose-5-phosphate synthase [Clostridia bacterium]|nr:1-deoxy-D-xylulose-5-phosphate synthase [Clostridia bacterium]
MNYAHSENNYEYLSKIKSPKDLEKVDNLEELCAEIRHKILSVVSKNGGHLASNLGVTELTVALHKIFSEPEDKIIWDVSHQCYAHKMLTGRFDKMDTIRKENGISGFTNRKESEYDAFTEGHSSTSISAALGLAYSKQIKKEPGYVVAVIGDGALSGGLAYEGINNAGQLKRNFILVINDNKMSISKNVGAVARCLNAARIRPSYMKAKNALEKILNKTSFGKKIKDVMKKSKSAVKRVIYKDNMLSNMGFAYYGPVDGHNLDELQKAFTTAKFLNKPVVVHVMTEKGKGYKFAEKKPKDYHCTSAFDIATGERISKSNSKTFSQEFGQAICDLGRKNPKICAITAAMTEGTCLQEFRSNFKNRFFDVGIAEEHAVTFAGGLSAGGMLPVFAVYSTFLQRAYDQILHDAALQGLRIVLAVDRAGFVGEDGETHQGIFDVPFLSTIPGVKIFSPSYIEELAPMLKKCTENEGISAIRYPKGAEGYKPDWFKYTGNDFDFYGNKNADVLIITYGRIFSNVIAANERMESIDKSACILKMNVIKPLKKELVSEVMKFNKVIFFEESAKSGSVSEKFGDMLIESGFNGKYQSVTAEDGFMCHASIKSQLKKSHLDTENIVRKLMFI